MTPEPIPLAYSIGSVPNPHQLEAARKVARLLDHEPQVLDTFRLHLKHLPTDGLFTIDNLLQGEEILVQGGIAARDRTSIRLLGHRPGSVELLAAKFMEMSPPTWLGIATRNGDLNLSMIPPDEAQTLANLFGDPERRDAFLLALHRKFDDAFRRAMGETAELLVLASCKELLSLLGAPTLAEKVLHASLISDQLGYDIRTPTVPGGTLRLEVKHDASPGEYRRFFLSRNEWMVAKHDPAWRLVVCRRNNSGEPEIEGWCDGKLLAPHIPSDTAQAAWQSILVTCPTGLLVPGLPDLAQ
ncbi:MAG: DUF3883 domain-containing protein [Verrucomicrobiota bacterium]